MHTSVKQERLIHRDANETSVKHKYQIHGEAGHLRYNGLPVVRGSPHRSTTSAANRTQPNWLQVYNCVFHQESASHTAFACGLHDVDFSFYYLSFCCILHVGC
jgi:hypothetical protein